MAHWLGGARAQHPGRLVDGLEGLAADAEASAAAAELFATAGVRRLLTAQPAPEGSLARGLAGALAPLVEVAFTDLGDGPSWGSLAGLRRARAERLAAKGPAEPGSALALALLLEDAAQAESEGRARDAATVYARALALEPTSLEATEGLRRVVEGAGRLRAAAAALVRLAALCRDPRRAAERFAEAALLFEAEGLVDDAAQAFLEVLRREPDDDEAFHRLLALAERWDRPADLERLLSFKLGRTGNNKLRVALYARRAQLRAGPLARPEEAIHDHRRILAIEPDRADSLRFLGRQALERGRPAAAVPFYERALPGSGDTAAGAEVRLELAQAYEAVDRHEDAVRVLRQAVDARPEDAAGRERLISLALRGRDHALAIEQLQALEALTTEKPARAALAVRRGRLERDRRNDRSAALVAFRTALELDPLGEAAGELVATVGEGPLSPEDAAAANQVIASLREPLARDPLDVRRLECLRDLAALRGLHDLRDVAAQLLSALGVGVARGRARDITRSVPLASLGTFGVPGSGGAGPGGSGVKVPLMNEIWPHLCEGVARIHAVDPAELGRQPVDPDFARGRSPAGLGGIGQCRAGHPLALDLRGRAGRARGGGLRSARDLPGAGPGRGGRRSWIALPRGPGAGAGAAEGDGAGSAFAERPGTGLGGGGLPGQRVPGSALRPGGAEGDGQAAGQGAVPARGQVAAVVRRHLPTRDHGRQRLAAGGHARRRSLRAAGRRRSGGGLAHGDRYARNGDRGAADARGTGPDPLRAGRPLRLGPQPRRGSAGTEEACPSATTTNPGRRSSRRRRRRPKALPFDATGIDWDKEMGAWDAAFPIPDEPTRPGGEEPRARHLPNPTAPSWCWTTCPNPTPCPRWPRSSWTISAKSWRSTRTCRDQCPTRRPEAVPAGRRGRGRAHGRGRRSGQRAGGTDAPGPGIQQRAHHPRRGRAGGGGHRRSPAPRHHAGHARARAERRGTAPAARAAAGGAHAGRRRAAGRVGAVAADAGARGGGGYRRGALRRSAARGGAGRAAAGDAAGGLGLVGGGGGRGGRGRRHHRRLDRRRLLEGATGPGGGRVGDGATGRAGHAAGAGPGAAVGGPRRRAGGARGRAPPVRAGAGGGPLAARGNGRPARPVPAAVRRRGRGRGARPAGGAGRGDAARGGGLPDAAGAGPRGGHARLERRAAPPPAEPAADRGRSGVRAVARRHDPRGRTGLCRRRSPRGRQAADGSGGRAGRVERRDLARAGRPAGRIGSSGSPGGAARGRRRLCPGSQGPGRPAGGFPAATGRGARAADGGGQRAGGHAPGGGGPPVGGAAGPAARAAGAAVLDRRGPAGTRGALARAPGADVGGCVRPGHRRAGGAVRPGAAGGRTAAGATAGPGAARRPAPGCARPAGAGW